MIILFIAFFKFLCVEEGIVHLNYVLGINTAPTITNLPLSSALSVPENGGLSASVYQVSVTDVDVGQTHTFYASYSPSTGSSLFSMNPTSKLFCL